MGSSNSGLKGLATSHISQQRDSAGLTWAVKPYQDPPLKVQTQEASCSITHGKPDNCSSLGHASANREEQPLQAQAGVGTKGAVELRRCGEMNEVRQICCAHA